jgi:hypothetical protein
MSTCQVENCEYNSKKNTIDHVHKRVIGGEVAGVTYDAYVVYELEKI